MGGGGREAGGWGYLWEVARAVANEQTGLSAAAIANDDEFLGVGGGLGDGGVAGVGGAVRANGAVAVALAGRAHGLANGGHGRRGRLGALLAAEVVVVGRRGDVRGHGGDGR